MIVKNDKDIDGLKKAGEVCSYIKNEVKDFVCEGKSTFEIDEYAGSLFKKTGFISGPKKIYNFPGNICLSVNSCVAHGVPSKKIILKNGDSINIDVSGSYNGFFSDCGISVVVGENADRQRVCDCAKDMFFSGLDTITNNSLLSDMGKEMENLCTNYGYVPIKKLTGHGIGKTLHEKPKHIHCNYMKWDRRRFKKNMVVAIETFVANSGGNVYIGKDGWSWIENSGAMTAQYEHTILITNEKPIILTE